MPNRHHLELAWLEDGIALAESLNFSKAAAARYVTQPAFSRRIQALEAWVGVALFERNRRGTRLTQAGEVFFHQAPDLIRALYALRSETRDSVEQRAPEVIMCATHALSFTFIPDWLRSNSDISRDGAFQLVSATLHACERMLTQGGAQFLLCHHHPHMQLHLPSQKFMSISLGQDRLIPYSIPTAGTRNARWTVDAAGGFPFLAYSADSGLGRIISNTAPLHRLTRTMETVFTSDLAATLLALVKAGEGVAWLPHALAAESEKSGAICRAARHEEKWTIPLDIRLYRPAARLATGAETLWESVLAGHQASPP
ncbi:LysR family transcriptional regulator [Candidatus Symbiopectobacterium sp. NZEC127]|uniref:LysR family transcriptional regulator n=1 Tax=Candidatus Symbiopectobacterium sp. NZEC127 TaxID=2820472 RepID=UPI0022276E5E|nr:LysR family transcriptional regulator [Candidatus Symbiopectobacterium sp. NZEC127]MCW2486801.1 LysR family transcriptional regulator [Candidatus Symbiopectobacterium sp. NZEC127]